MRDIREKFYFGSYFDILGWLDHPTQMIYYCFLTKVLKLPFLTILAQKASKVIIWIFSGIEGSSMKMRGSHFPEGGTQS